MTLLHLYTENVAPVEACYKLNWGGGGVYSILPNIKLNKEHYKSAETVFYCRELILTVLNSHFGVSVA